jgi:hypothetical protein
MSSSLQIKGEYPLIYLKRFKMSEIEKKGVLVTVPDTGNGIIVKFLQGHFQN